MTDYFQIHSIFLPTTRFKINDDLVAGLRDFMKDGSVTESQVYSF